MQICVASDEIGSPGQAGAALDRIQEAQERTDDSVNARRHPVQGCAGLIMLSGCERPRGQLCRSLTFTVFHK